MKIKKLKLLRRKNTTNTPVVRVDACATKPRQVPRFYGQSTEAVQAMKEFDDLIANGVRWVDSEDYRNPAPLGRFTVEYDEDGVPNYFEY